MRETKRSPFNSFAITYFVVTIKLLTNANLALKRTPIIMLMIVSYYGEDNFLRTKLEADSIDVLLDSPGLR